MAGQRGTEASAAAGSRPLRLKLAVFLIVLAGTVLWSLWPRSDVLNETRRLAAAGHTDLACGKLRRLLQESPQSDAARLLLATLQSDRDPAEALEVLSLVQPDGSRHAEADRLFRRIILELENAGTAMAVVQELTERHPENVVLAKALAGIGIRASDGRVALPAARRAVELAPNDVEALLLLADAFDGIGRQIDMVEPLNRVLTVRPGSYVAHANLAYAQRSAGNLPDALEHAQWCLARNPDDRTVRILKGQILRDLGRRQEALTEVRMVTRADRRNVAARILEAELLLFHKDFQAALDALQQLDESSRRQHDVRQLLLRARSLASGKSTGQLPAGQTEGSNRSGSAIRFEDVAAQWGLTLRHLAPLTELRHSHLTMGGGLGWGDFDRDGWPDLYFGQGRPFDPAHPLAADSVDPETDRSSNDRMFLNVDGRRFRDVTAECQIWNPEDATGIAIGDWNNDGFDDVFVSCYGPNRFFVNQGDGTFVETAQELKLDDARFSASSTWFDANSDGALDLYVTNYLRFDPHDYHLCTATQGGREIPSTCHPKYVPPEMDAVFLSSGNGRFQDITETAGFAAEPPRQGLGVAAADFDRDGDCDVYIANDAVPNQLWANEGGQFTDLATVAGVAINRAGESEAGMGVAIGDVNGDGLLDLFVTNYFGETNTLYRNEGNLLFLDVTDESGVGAPSRSRLGFGTTLLDADNDGWLDLFVANGHVIDWLEKYGRAGSYAQRALMLANGGEGLFRDVSQTAGPFFTTPVVGRGSAAADFDRDGRLDIAVQSLNGPCSLLRNQTPAAGSVFQVDLIGTAASRSAIGAVVTLEVGGRKLVRSRNGSTSYLSCDDGSLLFGAAGQSGAAVLTVYWPGGRVERIEVAIEQRRVVIIEGSSQAVAWPE